jgi:hypothetical protein
LGADVDISELESRLTEHAKWLADRTAGARLVIRKESIAYDFRGRDLTRAVIAHCDLKGSKFGRCVEANFAFSGGGDFSEADLTGVSEEWRSWKPEPVPAAKPQEPDYLTCKHRGQSTGDLLNCSCEIDRQIYRCEIRGTCLKRLPSGKSKDRFEILRDVEICHGCTFAG